MDVMLTLTWHVFFLTNHQNSNTKISTFEKTEVSVFFCIGYFAFRDGFFCSVLSPSLLRQRVVGVIVSVETAVLYKGDREKYQQYSLLILLTLNFGPIYIYMLTHHFRFLKGLKQSIYSGVCIFYLSTASVFISRRLSAEKSN